MAMRLNGQKTPVKSLVISGASSGLPLARRYLEQGAVAGAIARHAELLQSISEQFPNQDK